MSSAPDTPSAKMVKPTPKVRGFFLRGRHFIASMSFVMLVMAPTALSFFYLYGVAEDQYVSTVAFTVRSEEFQNPLEALSSLGQLSTGSSSDTDILYDFILSQKLVENVRDRIDLEKIYSKPEFDPVFAYEPGQPIEELSSYWERMVKVAYDSGAGLIRLKVFAFTPQDAHDIAAVIVDESDRLINQLSQIAQEDTTRYSKLTLEQATKRLRNIRQKLSTLRIEAQIIDPQIDLQSRMGVMTALQQKLADALVRDSALRTSAHETDPRVLQLASEINALRGRIVIERENLLTSSVNGGSGLVEVMGSYESLLVDTEFAQQSYIAAASAYDIALAEAQRRSRYLATHIPPTLPESALHPQRLLLGLAVAGFSLLFWLILLLTVYAARDRR